MLKQRAPTRTEVAAALAANRQAGFDLAARTPTHRMLAQAVNQVFQRWLDGDPIDPDEVRALEVQVLAAGRWCKETDGGVDHWADIRAERVALLRRIREHCGTNTTERKFRSVDTPQIAHTESQDWLAQSPTNAGSKLGVFPAGSTHVQRRTATNGARHVGRCEAMSAEAARQRRRETVATNLRRIRLSRDLTQDQLANAVEARREHVNRWENAVWEPSADYIERLAEVLDVPVHEFYVASTAATSA